jgi:hypothetical protein
MLIVRSASVGLVLLVAGGASPTTLGPALLPSVSIGSLPFVGEPPIHPFVAEADGPFTRILFGAAGPANTTVTIRDVMVGPRTTRQIAALPGPALLERLEGHGSISFPGNAAQTLGDEMQVVSGSHPVTVSNPNGTPLGFRLYIFAGE